MHATDVTMISCRRMTTDLIPDAFSLLNTFLGEDPHYLASSPAYGHKGSPALRTALDMFLARPEIGFVWLAYYGDRPVGVCVISYAISTSVGGIVAKLDDVFVSAEAQGKGVGSELLKQLKAELLSHDVVRIDTSAHLENGAARRFYLRNGFQTLNEERLSCLLG